MAQSYVYLAFLFVPLGICRHSWLRQERGSEGLSGCGHYAGSPPAPPTQAWSSVVRSLTPIPVLLDAVRPVPEASQMKGAWDPRALWEAGLLGTAGDFHPDDPPTLAVVFQGRGGRN